MEIVYLLRHPRDFPWREFSANIYKSGVTALPVTALLGFMIGVAMSYLMAMQLHNFGADIFIVNILGLGIIRELGPMLMAILIAGRSGSAMTAQIGVMRVTEEIDALTTMGISRILRIILPKVLGLTFVAPFLVLWTSGWALTGGALSAYLQLDINFRFFFDYLPSVVQPVNLTLSLVKGLLFGFVVTLVACHFGLRIKPNTESLSRSTTELGSDSGYQRYFNGCIICNFDPKNRCMSSSPKKVSCQQKLKSLSQRQHLSAKYAKSARCTAMW